MPDFLLEIGCEEIPARMIDDASKELCERITALLSRERLTAGAIDRFETPRRLALIASEVSAAQPDSTEQLTGPSAKIAYKDGQPTPAAHAFAKKAGIDVAQLETVSTAKGEYLSAKVTRKGRPAAEILTENLPKEIASIYWPKNMYWRKQSALAGCHARWRNNSAGVRWSSSRQHFARAQNPLGWRRNHSESGIGVRRCATRGEGIESGRTRATDSQSSRRRYTHDFGRALAGR
jgi:hypothetical protein